jgi:hypothetical protein
MPALGPARILPIGGIQSGRRQWRTFWGRRTSIGAPVSNHVVSVARSARMAVARCAILRTAYVSWPIACYLWQRPRSHRRAAHEEGSRLRGDAGESMGHRTHSRSAVTLAFAVAVAALVLQGCWLFAKNYPAPPEPLRPTMAGVIESGAVSADGNVVTFEDGTKVDIPSQTKGIGSGYQKGNLFMSGADGGGFVAVLLPDRRGNGCWEAWEDINAQIAWDMGDSILFLDRLELPKAPGYHVDLEPHTVNGHLAWTDPTNGSMPQWMSFCANAKGQIEWGQKNP